MLLEPRHRSPSYPRDGHHPRATVATKDDEGRLEMYGDRFYVLEDRALREQDFAERVAERNRYARAKRRSSWRAQLARRLFALAVAAEREETWRLVWEKLEARGRL